MDATGHHQPAPPATGNTGEPGEPGGGDNIAAAAMAAAERPGISEKERVAAKIRALGGVLPADATALGESPPGARDAAAAPAAAEPAHTERSAPAPAAAPASAAERTPSPPARTGQPPAGDQNSVRRVLRAGGAPDELYSPVLQTLGPAAAETLREDPWQLLAVPGVAPEQGDAFARALLGDQAHPQDTRRGRALLLWALRRAVRLGHTCAPAERLHEELLRHGVSDPDAALRDAVADGGLMAFHDPVDPSAAPATDGSPSHQQGTGQETDHGAGQDTVQHDDQDVERAEDSGDDAGKPAAGQPTRLLLSFERYALAEESLAEALTELASTARAFPLGRAHSESDAGTDAARRWEDAAARSFPGAAGELVRATARHGLVLHTGAEAARAETAALLRAAWACGLRARVATLTPDSQQRMRTVLETEPPGVEPPEDPDAELAGGAPADAAVTLDGLLSGHAVARCPDDGALELDLLVLADAQLLDTESLAHVAESLPDGARLVLGGDPAQLWSAGPGRVFADLLASRLFWHVASRTPGPGPLGELLSGIGAGELLAVHAPDREVVVVPVAEPREAVHRAGQLAADSVPRALGIAAEDTQVIAPFPEGPAGTRELNQAFKERFNPGPGRFAGFDPGDRVVLTLPLEQGGDSGGSVTPRRHLHGTVLSGGADGLRVGNAAETVTLAPEIVGRLTHGWAVTVRQAAGHRWPAVVLVLSQESARRPLNRQLVYTAVAAAGLHISVVQGAGPRLAAAVAEVPAVERGTRLQTVLWENHRAARQGAEESA